MSVRSDFLICQEAYSGILDDFHGIISRGASPNDAINFIHNNSEPYCSCITQIALAECLWHVGLVTQENINAAKSCLRSKELIDYFHSLEADDTYINTFQNAASRMLNSLSAPVPDEENWLLSGNAHYQKGECFWYKSNKTIYGAAILEKQRDLWLIALTERIIDPPKNSDALLNLPLYTLAWFSDETLLPKKKLHVIGTIDITKSFVNKFGLYENNGSLRITNYGQSLTWKHQFQMCRVKYTLSEITSTAKTVCK